MTSHRAKAHTSGWLVLLLGLFGLLGASMAQESPKDGSTGVTGSFAAPSGPGGGGAAVAKLSVLSAGATCRACEPKRTHIELIFSSPVDTQTLLDEISITPKVKLRSDQQGEVRRVELSGNLKAQTRYEVELGQGFCAEDGSCLAKPATLSFRTGGGWPRVRMPVHNTVLPPGRKLPMRFEQIERATLVLVPIRSSEVPSVLALVGAHPHGARPLQLLPEALRGRAKTIDIDCERDAPDGAMQVDPFADGRGTLVLALLSGKGARSKVALYQQGAMGALLKLGPDRGLIWVTDTATGQPVAGASVTIVHGAHTTFRATTSGQGLVMLPKRGSLQRKGQTVPLHAIVQKGQRLVVAGEDWTDGINRWMFDLPYYYYSGGQRIRGMVTAERGIYRPGSAVHLLGVMRQKMANGTLAPPRGTAELELRSPDGTVVARHKAPITRFGTVRWKAQLPPHGKVGRYHASLTKDGVTLRHSFEVGDFRPATFEVKMPPAGSVEWDGDELLVPVQARYLHGGPVAGGKIKWAVSWRNRRIHFTGLETFRFRDDGLHFYRSAQLLTGGDGVLDGDGRFVVRVPHSALPEVRWNKGQSLDFIIEATVSDAADDTVTSRTVQRVDRTDALVGVGTKQWVVSSKTGWSAQVIAVSPDGTPLAGRHLELELKRTYYNSVAEKGSHGVRYRSSQQSEVVASRQLVTKAAPLDVRFDIKGGGTYELVVKEQGKPFAVSRSVWAYGKDSVGPALNTARFDLHLDKQSYQPGDVAQIHAALPYPKSTVLITVERGGVMHARVEQLDGAERPIAVRVTEQHLPNVYVGVAAVPREAGKASPAAGFPYRAGYTEIRVSPERRRLSVEVEPAKAKLQPGEQAAVRVRVRDQQGRPVSAEVTLWAADEGVLMLTGYRTPDPFRPAYAHHELDVVTAFNLGRWTNYDPAYWYDGGGDGGLTGSALRSRFLYTAFFSQGVVTGADGQATVRFDLPDNVTRWRVMAVAADQGQRFGKGESSIVASKPLMVTPSVPRFVTEGDLVDAGLVVHNHTGADAEVKVELQLDGADLLGPSERKIDVPAGKQRAVRFPALVREAGQLRVQARAQLAAARDGFELVLPAHRATKPTQDLLAQGTIGRRMRVGLWIPQSARAGSAEVALTVSPTVLASLEAGLDSLLDYPYGCAEQKTSRLIPMVALGDLIRELELGGLDELEHRRRLQATIAELGKHQNPDGGFGLWERSESESFLSAYVLFGLQVARDHGYDVSVEQVHRARVYLQEQVRLDKLDPGYFGFDARVLTAYVLNRAGSEESALTAQLYETRSELDRFEQGLLATALAKSDAAKAAELLAELEQARQSPSQGQAIIAERSSASGAFAHGRDVRATASVVHALAAAGRAAEAEPLVAGILAKRQSDGTWGSTYNNLWVLLALSSYADGQTAHDSGATVTVKLNGQMLRQLSLPSRTTTRRLVLPASLLPDPGAGGLMQLESPADARIRYAVRLRYSERPEAQKPIKKGYEVERELFDAETGAPIVIPKVGQLVRVRLRVHTDGYRHQVALTDYLPAGFEAVNARLQTAQRKVEVANGWRWHSHEIRDDRVSFFAYGLGDGTHQAEYLARASRSGEFVWPAAVAQSMYNPEQLGRGSIEQMVVTR